MTYYDILEYRNAYNCYKVELKIRFILNLEHLMLQYTHFSVLNNIASVKYLKYCMSVGRS